MKTVLSFSALPYEAPQAELLQICVEQNLLTSQTGSGQNVTFSDEQDFDDYFNN